MPVDGGIVQENIFKKKALEEEREAEDEERKRGKKKHQLVCFCVPLVNVSSYCVVLDFSALQKQVCLGICNTKF